MASRGVAKRDEPRPHTGCADSPLADDYDPSRSVPTAWRAETTKVV